MDKTEVRHPNLQQQPKRQSQLVKRYIHHPATRTWVLAWVWDDMPYTPSPPGATLRDRA